MELHAAGRKHFTKDYPLTHFQDYLATRGLAPATVKLYTSCIRQLLGWLEEGKDEVKHKWKDHKLVRLFLDSREDSFGRALARAWGYWLEFNGEPRAGIMDVPGQDMPRLRASLEMLERWALKNKNITYSVIDLRIDYLRLHWQRQETRWCFVSTKDKTLRLRIFEAEEPWLKILRTWGHPYSDPHGKPVFPKDPGSSEMMPTSTYYLLWKAVPDVRIVKSLEGCVSSEITRLFHKKNNIGTPIMHDLDTP